MTRLVVPAPEHLEAYAAALSRGWSPNTTRPEQAQEELAALRADPVAFLAMGDDPTGAGPPVTLPDGRTVPRLPGLKRWIWADGFCGSINLRWQAGTTGLPPHCLGHIGYAVVPWRQREGHATAALRALLPLARAVGLPFVELTTDPHNLASQRVIEANGGVLVERFTKPAAFGGTEGLKYRIDLPR
jgi:predicted acetyltransferase